jgi:hypothetical protein
MEVGSAEWELVHDQETGGGLIRRSGARDLSCFLAFGGRAVVRQAV